AAAGSELSPLRALKLALRDARLTHTIACLFGWDVCLAEGHTPPADILTELFAHPDLVIIAGQAAWPARGLERERRLFSMEFPTPTYAQRRTLWQHFLSRPPAGLHEGLDITVLAGQFALTTGQIRDAVASAWDMAVQHGQPLQNQDLLAAARAHSNPGLASLARKLTPRYDWADIILPADQLAILREIVGTVRGRPLVLDDWGVGQKLASSRGVTVLFAGPPGTGKTMAAEIIAAELGLDLYKIDLSTVVSKYIGETEKNLEQIFREAASSNAILFFDEADAIFGKRSEVKDAHDRYANIEISYLLQRMEMYDGVTILATNLRANLDEAFTRRLQFAVDFPFPEEADRRRIWQTLFPPDVPHDPNLDFDFLARRFKLAGGNIRNIIVSAAYLAAADGQVVTMTHLLHSTRRELQKMGRLVGEEDLRLS
ncbi:MAG: ATP-binding protein, partial [Chloroflexota bacterium]